MYKELSVNLSKWYLPLFPVFSSYYRFLPVFATGKEKTSFCRHKPNPDLDIALYAPHISIMAHSIHTVS